ncbi:DUF6483 family protein [Cohnella suwonensis]|uniref:DUF6483 family protein n=1 Tax=Cohnella suwonensis TaxID=696072 RepID=A0ABW0LTN3_9BACL
MFERDYLIRLLAQAGAVLGKAAGLKDLGKPQEALQTIDEFMSRELRLRSRLAMGLTDEDLLSMLSLTGSPNAESVAIVASCLKQEAELYASLGEEDESVPRFEKSLRLTLHALRNELEAEGWDARKRAEELIASLDPYETEADTKKALWGWHEEEGRFADAENLLFELGEAGALSAEEGQAFYTRLSGMEDAALDAGGLPRDEMEEGRRQWGALTKENEA